MKKVIVVPKTLTFLRTQPVHREHVLTTLAVGSLLVGLLAVCSLNPLTLASTFTRESTGAQANFVYTNDDVFGANTVSGFSVDDNGNLARIKHSPFLTGGIGSGEGYFGAKRIVTSPAGNFIFVSNAGDNSVSVFSIDPSTGFLTLVLGSPFSLTGRPGVTQAITLAVTNDGHFLFACGTDGCDITVFTIAANGALAPVQGSPFKGCDGFDAVVKSVGGMKATPDGKLLSVSEPGDHKVGLFRISDDGALAAIPSSSQFGFGVTFPIGIEITCAGDILFATDSAGGAKIHSFTIGPNGTLSINPGSPYNLDDTLTGDVLELTPNNRFLFVSNQFIPRITSFSVLPNGVLKELRGSPFPVAGGNNSVGMATDQQGRFLYVASFQPNVITVFQIMRDGGLTPVPDTSFVSLPGTLQSIAAYPAAPSGCISPRITDAKIVGKALVVSGEKFGDGAVIYIDNQKQKTANDETNRASILIARKGVKSIEPGHPVSLQVQNRDGALSQEFSFTRQ
jgi:6-phosphogluconolactonase